MRSLSRVNLRVVYVARNLHEGLFAARIDLACTAGRLQYTVAPLYFRLFSNLEASTNLPQGALFRCDRGCKKT